MKWFVRTKRGARGPFTFRQLRGYVAKGVLLRESRVRTDESDDWGFAEDIPGLFRNAATTEEPELTVESDNSGERAAPPVSGLRKPVKRRHWLIGAMTLLAVAIIIMVSFKMLSPPPFAGPSYPDLALSDINRLRQIVPPAPDSPTLAIPVLEPQPVPGVAPRPWSKCPSVDQSLCHLTFIAPIDGTNSILYATRAEPSAGFSEPSELFSQIEGIKDYCSLSPSGLEILFCLFGEPNTIWHSKRETRETVFPPPTQMHFPDLETTPVHLGGSRWIDNNTIQMSVTDLAYTRRKLHVLERTPTNDSFRLSYEVPLVDEWKRHAVTTDGLRAYTQGESGLLISARKAADSQFIIPEVLVDRTVCGPTMEQDFMFVVKNEDVLFFAGPGANRSEWEHNQLWMLRLR